MHKTEYKDDHLSSFVMSKGGPAIINFVRFDIITLKVKVWVASCIHLNYLNPSNLKNQNLAILQTRATNNIPEDVSLAEIKTRFP